MGLWTSSLYNHSLDDQPQIHDYQSICTHGHSCMYLQPRPQCCLQARTVIGQVNTSPWLLERQLPVSCSQTAPSHKSALLSGFPFTDANLILPVVNCKVQSSLTLPFAMLHPVSTVSLSPSGKYLRCAYYHSILAELSSSPV